MTRWGLACRKHEARMMTERLRRGRSWCWLGGFIRSRVPTLRARTTRKWSNRWFIPRLRFRRRSQNGSIIMRPYRSSRSCSRSRRLRTHPPPLRPLCRQREQILELGINLPRSISSSPGIWRRAIIENAISGGSCSVWFALTFVKLILVRRVVDYFSLTRS